MLSVKMLNAVMLNEMSRRIMPNVVRLGSLYFVCYTECH
jgi:hypothetical protein